MPDAFQTGEALELGNLPAYWDQIELLYREILRIQDGPTDSTALTARAFDHSQPAGHRAYMGASRYLMAAMDNTRALPRLLTSHGASLWAPWSLLRPTFECAFWAAWIMDPDDGVTRRRRGLQSEILDAKAQDAHLREFGKIPVIAKEVGEELNRRQLGKFKAYRDEADQLGVKWEIINQKVNVTDELPKLSFVDHQNDPAFSAFTVAMWRLLSGFEHGTGWALVRGAKSVTRAKVPGGELVEFVMKDDDFVNAGKVCYFMLISACRTYLRRLTSA
jgi:hypothetical protein